MKGPLRFGLGALLLALGVMAGCGGSNEVSQEQSDEVVFDSLLVLNDGDGYAIKLDAGTYKVEMTASDDGATVKWVGSACPESEATDNYSVTCEMTQTGQLIVEHPTALATGASTSVTLKVTMVGN